MATIRITRGQPITRRLLVIVALLLATPVGEAGELTATLTVVPDRILPGLPVSFLVELHNAGSDEIVLYGGAALQVQRDGGTPFLATWSDVSSSMTLAPKRLLESDHLRLEPGASVTVHFGTDALMAGPEFLWDERLNLPGEYSARIRFLERSTSEPRFWFSTPATWTVQDPSGAEAEVWSMMREADPTWSVESWLGLGMGVAIKVSLNGPRSGYTPYTLLLTPNATTEIENVLEQRNDDPVYDLLAIRLASNWLSQCDRLISAGRKDEAKAAGSKARKILEGLIARTGYPFVREEATEALKLVQLRSSAMALAKP